MFRLYIPSKKILISIAILLSTSEAQDISRWGWLRNLMNLL